MNIDASKKWIFGQTIPVKGTSLNVSQDDESGNLVIHNSHHMSLLTIQGSEAVEVAEALLAAYTTLKKYSALLEDYGRIDDKNCFDEQVRELKNSLVKQTTSYCVIGCFEGMRLQIEDEMYLDSTFISYESAVELARALLTLSMEKEAFH